MARRPVAYLRRSRVDATRAGAVSHEAQLAEVRSLAERYGEPGELEILEDWGRSGRGERTHLRASYLHLRALIEADEVSAVYGYSTSRLARSLSEYVSLAQLCQAHDVAIRTREGALDYATVEGRLLVHLLASVSQAEAEWAQERAADAARVRRARGDRMGPAFYGTKVVGGQLVADPSRDVAAVLDAFRAAGSFLGAAKLLNAAGVPTRHGGDRLWWAGSVRNIVEREAPALVPPRQRRGARATGSFLLSGLLRCSCGRTLTGKRDLGKYIYYQCADARRDPRHPHPHSVPERRLLPAIVAEAERLRTPDAVRLAEADAQRRADLAERKRRLALTFADGALDEPTYRRELEAIEDEETRLAAAARVVAVPTLDWSWEPARLNSVLRAMFEYIALDTAMAPIEFRWSVPEWRADGAPASPETVRAAGDRP
jgi:DNA invertase Pin-like site-specific DNA recombinase